MPLSDIKKLLIYINVFECNDYSKVTIQYIKKYAEKISFNL